MLRTSVALLTVVAAFAVAAAALAQGLPPEAPQGVRLQMRDGGPLITWLPVPGAEFYEVRGDPCETGSPNICLVSSTKEASWQGTAAEIPETGFLVVACNSDSGCGEPVRPKLIDDRPEAPERIIVEQTPEGVLVSWSPVEGASEYQVIYDARLSRMCHLGWPEQDLLQCLEAGRTTDTRFLHQDAHQLQARYYWVAACNQAGCRKGKGRGAEIGNPVGGPSQESESAATARTGKVVAALTLSRQSVREGENFTATLRAEVPSGEPGILNLRINADGPLHVNAVAGQESCGPGCVSLVRRVNGGESDSLSASFTAGQKGSAKILGAVKWEPDGAGEPREDSDERNINIFSRQDSSGPVIRSSGSEPAPPPPARTSGSDGCAAPTGSAGSLALIGLLVLPVLGLVARPLRSVSTLTGARPTWRRRARGE